MAIGLGTQFIVGPAFIRASIYKLVVHPQYVSGFYLLSLWRAVRLRVLILAAFMFGLVWIVYAVLQLSVNSDNIVAQAAVQIGGVLLGLIFTMRRIDVGIARRLTLEDMHDVLCIGQPRPNELSDSELQHIGSADGAPSKVLAGLNAIRREMGARKMLQQPKRRYDWPDVVMLLIIMASLMLVFLVGIALTAGKAGFTSSSDVVAVLAPALAAVGTVAAGIFGYSLGARGGAQAQQEAAAVRQDAARITADARPLTRTVRRIVNQALPGAESEPGKRNVSEDDLRSLLDQADAASRALGMES